MNTRRERTIKTKEKRRTAGFTMAELLMAVAILIILMGFGAVALIHYQRSLKLTEMDATAKEIFIAAQNQMMSAKANGEWDALGKNNAHKDNKDKYFGESMISGPSDYATSVEGANWEKDSKDTTKHQFYYIHVTNGSPLTGNILEEMLPFGSIDGTIREGGGCYVIEYDYVTASVYGVFYTDDAKGFEYSTCIDKSDGNDLRASKTNRRGHNPIIGYYGGAAANALEKVTLDKPELNIINSDKLIATVTDTNYKNYNGYKTQLTVTITGEESKDNKNKPCKQIYSIIIDSNYNKTSGPSWCTVEKGEDSSAVYTLILDDITSTGMNFAALFCKNLDGIKKNNGEGDLLYPGENITVNVTLSTTEKLANVQSDNDYTNSLFEAKYENKDSKGKAITLDASKSANVTIANIRHLENLNATISGINVLSTETLTKGLVINKAAQTKNIDWAAAKDAEDPSKVDWKSSSIYSYSSESSMAANSFVGIENSALTEYDGGKNILSNFEINASGDNNSGLFATIGNSSSEKQTFKAINLTLDSFNVTSENGSAGTLLGATEEKAQFSAKNITVTDSTVKATGKGNAGGLAGTALSGGTIEECGVYLTDVPKDTLETVAAKYQLGAYNTTTNTAGNQYNIQSKSGNAGGLVGASSETILNSFASVPVITESGNAGGLAGKVDNSAVTNSYSGGYTIEAQYKDYVSVAATNATGISGGLIGNATSVAVTNSFANGAVYGTTAGGLVGDNSAGSFTDSYATGSIFKSKDSTNAVIGTFIGSNESSELTITSCYNLKDSNSSTIKAIGNLSGNTSVESKSFKDLSALSTDIVQTFNYDSALNKKNYPFPAVNETCKKQNADGTDVATGTKVYYGDWTEASEDFEAEVVYYEIYDDSKDGKSVYNIGFYNMDDKLKINTLSADEDVVIVQDGYAVLTSKNAVYTTEFANNAVSSGVCSKVDAFGNELLTLRHVTKDGEDGLAGMQSVNLVTGDDQSGLLTLADGREFYLQFMPLVTVDAISGNTYYGQLEVSCGDYKKYFYLNTHYAKSLIQNNIDDVEANCTIAEPNTINISNSKAGNVSIRTERQYSMMTQDLQNPGSTNTIDMKSVFAVFAFRYYQQERNLTFGDKAQYTDNYFNVSTRNAFEGIALSVPALAPIAVARNTMYKNSVEDAQDTCGFAGVYDGQNQTITSLSITATDAGESAGMFGNTKGARIENLTLADISVTGNKFVGALIGSAAHGTKGGTGATVFTEITNVIISGGTVTGTTYVGGLAGAAHSCAVNQTNPDNVVLLRDVTVNGTACAGGVFGLITDYSNKFTAGYSIQNITMENSVVNETGHLTSTSSTVYELGTGAFTGKVKVKVGNKNTQVKINNVKIKNSNVTISKGTNPATEFTASSLWIGVYDYRVKGDNGTNYPFVFSGCKVTDSTLLTSFVSGITGNMSRASYGGLYGLVCASNGPDKLNKTVYLDSGIIDETDRIQINGTAEITSFCDLGGLVGKALGVGLKLDSYSNYKFAQMQNFTNVNTYNLGNVVGGLTNAALKDYNVGNLTLISDISARYEGGLIGTVTGGSEVTGIRLNNASTAPNNSVDTGAANNCNLGGIIGRVQGNGISDITITGTIDFSKFENAANVGGLVGFADSNSNNTFQNLTLADATTSLKGQNVGGLIGKASNGLKYNAVQAGGATVNGTSTVGITNSNDVNKESNFGGLIGYVLNGQLRSSDASGMTVGTGDTSQLDSSVTVNATNGFDNIGGAIGRSDNALSDISAVSTMIRGEGVNVGGVIGKTASGGTKKNLTATSVTLTTIARNAGGLIGANAGSTIQDSTINAISVTNTENDTTYGAAIGGAVGQAGAGTCTGISGNGTVSLINNDGTRASYAGGLIGRITDATSYVNSLTMTGVVTCEGATYAGGAVGGATSAKEIKNIYCDKLTVNASNTTAVGGVFGYSSKGIYSSDATDIIVNGENNVGGFAGYLENASTSDCGVYLPTANTKLNVAKYEVKGTGNVGGFAGNSNGGKIENCYAAIPVNGLGNTAVIGGFVGAITKGTLLNCYASGDVTNVNYDEGSFTGGFAGTENAILTVNNCYSTGDVNKGYYIGGFMGGLINHTSTAAMNNCYSLGKVDQQKLENAGGFVGLCEGNITQETVAPDEEMIVLFFKMINIDLIDAYKEAVVTDSSDTVHYRNCIIALMKRLSVIPQTVITDEEANSYVKDQSKLNTLKSRFNNQTVCLANYLKTLNYSVDYGATCDVLKDKTPSTAQTFYELMNTEPYQSINMPGWFIPAYSNGKISLYYLSYDWNYVYQSLTNAEKTEFLKKSYQGYSYAWTVNTHNAYKLEISPVAIKFANAQYENHNDGKPYLKFSSTTTVVQSDFEYQTGCVYLHDTGYNDATSWSDDKLIDAGVLSQKTFAEMTDDSTGSDDTSYTYMNRLNQDTNNDREIKDANPKRFEWSEPSKTHQYDPNLPDTYPFPAISAITASASGTHWGDWPDNTTNGLIYYEKVQGDDTLYYHGYIKNNYVTTEISSGKDADGNIFETDTGKYVSEDGYLIAVAKGTSAENINILCSGINVKLNEKYKPVTDEFIVKSDLGQKYDLYYMDMSATPSLSEKFASGAAQVTITESETGGKDTKIGARKHEFIMTPYFADSVAVNVNDTTIGTAKKPFKIRSARQLNNLASDKFNNVYNSYITNASYVFVQGLDIVFSTENGTSYKNSIGATRKNGAAVLSVAQQGMHASYHMWEKDGTSSTAVSYVIRGIQCSLFGTIQSEATIQGITLEDVQNATDQGGAFAKDNHGIINSCNVIPSDIPSDNAAASYEKVKVVRNQATAGFLWTNYGVIENSSFTGTVQNTAKTTNAEGKAEGCGRVSGFVDINKGQIYCSYANANLLVDTSNSSELVGFTQSNRGGGYISDSHAIVQSNNYPKTVGFVQENGYEKKTDTTEESSIGTIKNCYVVLMPSKANTSIKNAFVADNKTSEVSKGTIIGYAYYLDYNLASNVEKGGATSISYKSLKEIAKDNVLTVAEGNTIPVSSSLNGIDYPFPSPDTTNVKVAIRTEDTNVLSSPYLSIIHYGDWPAEPDETNEIGLVYYEKMQDQSSDKYKAVNDIHYHGLMSSPTADGRTSSYEEVPEAGSTDMLLTDSNQYVAEEGYLVLIKNEISIDNVKVLVGNNDVREELLAACEDVNIINKFEGYKVYYFRYNEVSSLEATIVRSDVNVTFEVNTENVAFRMTPFFGDSVKAQSETASTEYYVRSSRQLKYLAETANKNYVEGNAAEKNQFIQLLDINCEQKVSYTGFAAGQYNYTSAVDRMDADYQSQIVTKEYEGEKVNEGYTIKNIEATMFRTVNENSLIEGVTLVDTKIKKTTGIKDYKSGFVTYNQGTFDSCVIRSSQDNIYSSAINSAEDDIGGFVYTNSGTIKNCAVIGNITGNNVAGFAYKVTADGSIENCYSNANVTGSNFASGFVNEVSEDATVKNCHSLYQIVSNGNAAGFVKSNSGTIENCYAALNSISVGKASSENWTFAQTSGNLTNCFSYEGTKYITSSKKKNENVEELSYVSMVQDEKQLTAKTTHKYGVFNTDVNDIIYPFAITSDTPYLTMQHWGDWPAEPTKVGIAYCETYDENVIGWFAAISDVNGTAEKIYDTLSVDAGEIVDDNATYYGLLVKSGSSITSTVEVDNEKKNTVDIDGVSYDFYPFSASGTSHTNSSVTVTGNDNASVTFHYNSDFAGAVSANKDIVGTDSRPYQIRTQQQLRNINENRSVYCTKQFRQTIDISLKNDNFAPIGGYISWQSNTVDNNTWSSMAFTGVYDAGIAESGNSSIMTSEGVDGYKISEMVQNISFDKLNSENQRMCSGLFGYLTGTIKNLSISGTVTISEKPGNGRGYLGTFAGKCAGGTLSNCNSEVNINADYSCDETYIGGFVAESSGKIENCQYTGKINTTVEINDNKKWVSRCGGFIGHNTGSIEKSSIKSDQIVVHAYSNGNSSYQYLGGFVGIANDNSDISECFSNTTLDGSTRGNGNNLYIGGFTGYVDSGNVQLSNCYSITELVTTNGNKGSIGIFVGRNVSGKRISYCHAIEKNANSILNSILLFTGSPKFGVSGISNCFEYANFDSNQSGVTNLTNGEYLTASKFTGFDFTNTWEITNDLYPTLKNNPENGIATFDLTDEAVTETTEEDASSKEIETEEIPMGGIAYREVTADGYEGYYAVAVNGEESDASILDTLSTKKGFALADDAVSYGVLVEAGTVPTVEGVEVDTDKTTTVTIDGQEYDFYTIIQTDDAHENIEVAVTSGEQIFTFTINPDFAAAISYDGAVGASSEENGIPYQIRTAAQLRNINANTVSYADKSFHQTADIALSGEDFAPIGGTTGTFSGTYDATIVGAETDEELEEGYSITGLNQNVTMKGSEGEQHTAGLFGTVTGTVKNVTLSGKLTVSKEADNSRVSGFVGSIAGMNAGTIENCNADVSMNIDTSAMEMSIGGIAGFSEGTLEHDYYNGWIGGAVKLQKEAGYSVYTGGLVGQNRGKIERSAASGIYNLSIRDSAEITYAGGLIGWTYDKDSTVIESWSKIAFMNQDSTTGGLVGRITGTEKEHTSFSDDYAISAFTSVLTADMQDTMTYTTGLFAGEAEIMDVTRCHAAEMAIEDGIDMDKTWKDLHVKENVTCELKGTIQYSNYSWLAGNTDTILSDSFVLAGNDSAAFKALKAGKKYEFVNNLYPTLKKNPERDGDIVAPDKLDMTIPEVETEETAEDSIIDEGTTVIGDSGIEDAGIVPEGDDTTQTQDTQATTEAQPETSAPETQVPETQMPETEPQTQAPTEAQTQAEVQQSKQISADESMEESTE